MRQSGLRSGQWDEQMKVWTAMSRQRSVFLVTQGSEGPMSVPVDVQVRPEENLVWLLADRSVAEAGNLESRRRVALVFIGGSARHLSVRGRAGICDDRKRVKSLWNAAAQALHPMGPDDHQIVAIRIQPEMAELWDGPAALVSRVAMKNQA